MISWINGLFALLAVILLATVNGEDIRYFRSATLTQEEGTVAVSVAINDSLSRQEFRRDGLSQITPLNYSMDLHTGICFDNKCRPLKIVVYWNITGRYLGFELLDGEYLSKYDHEPFSEAGMDSHLFAKILESPDPSDQTWAAERVAQLQKMDGEALAGAVRLLREGDYFQGYLLLRSLSRDQLASDSLQLELFNLIGAVGSNLETAVIDRLSEVSRLSPVALDHSFGMIGGLSGQQVIRLLKLYDRHDVRDPRLYEALKGLLPHENAFVGRQIAQFMERQGVSVN